MILRSPPTSPGACGHGPLWSPVVRDGCSRRTRQQPPRRRSRPVSCCAGHRQRPVTAQSAVRSPPRVRRTRSAHPGRRSLAGSGTSPTKRRVPPAATRNPLSRAADGTEATSCSKSWISTALPRAPGVCPCRTRVRQGARCSSVGVGWGEIGQGVDLARPHPRDGDGKVTSSPSLVAFRISPISARVGPVGFPATLGTS